MNHCDADTDPLEDDAGEDGESAEDGVVRSVIETTTTNLTDDFAHRGAKLQAMPFYVYALQVKRVLRKKGHLRRFAFEDHCPLSKQYEQEVCR